MDLIKEDFLIIRKKIKMKVLILYTDFGSGHRNVALTVKKKLEAKNHQIEMYNAKKVGSKYSTKIYEYVYNRIITKNVQYKTVKKGYGILFKFLNKQEFIIKKIITETGQKQVIQKINEINPDIIINTYPYEFSTEKKVITIITDYGLSNFWVLDNTSCYLVPSRMVGKQLQEKKLNLPKEIYQVPLSLKIDKVDLEQKLESVLFNLGARGQFSCINIINNIDNIIEYNSNIKINIICGKNKKLYLKIHKKYKHKKNIMVYAFVDNMEEIIQQNNLIITKAGGMAITEAWTLGKPLIINETQSLTGQEEYNINFCLKNKIGTVKTEKLIYQDVIEYLKSPNLYHEKLINLNELQKEYNELENDINHIIKG